MINPLVYMHATTFNSKRREEEYTRTHNEKQQSWSGTSNGIVQLTRNTLSLLTIAMNIHGDCSSVGESVTTFSRTVLVLLMIRVEAEKTV
jgi:hypothetical protein